MNLKETGDEDVYWIHLIKTGSNGRLLRTGNEISDSIKGEEFSWPVKRLSVCYEGF
jgi:hypothetical protein